MSDRDPIADYVAPIVIGPTSVTVGGVEIPGVIEEHGVKIRPGDALGEWIVDVSLVTGRAPVIATDPIAL